MIFNEKTKSIPITKEMVWEAYKKVKSSRGSAGVDRQSLEDFDKVRSKELYKLWNRLSSGSYFPQHVKRVEILKADGKKRPLGIPTVSDRIAQQVIKTYLEPRLEAIFVDHSFGYRPKKSAHGAIQEVLKNVRKYSWVIDMDIQGFFDNVDHRLLFTALERHVSEKWILLYVRRWLESPIELKNGNLIESAGKGTPQGGVISPLLANLFLHYVIDKWILIHYPHIVMVRYADDFIIHCQSQRDAKGILASVKGRLLECGLTAHPEKTKIVYCKKDGRSQEGHSVQFDFLGFSFRPIMFRLRKGGHFLQYDCIMSRKSKTRILKGLRDLNFHNRSQVSLQEIAALLNPRIRGWINYYGKINRRSLKPVFYYLHHRIIRGPIDNNFPI